MPKRTPFPHLRRPKGGDALYFETPGTRKWIALGTDEVAAMARYKELMRGRAAVGGTVGKLLIEYLDFLRSGGVGPKGRPVKASTLKLYAKYLRHLSNVFGLALPAEITQAAVARYLMNCKRKGARSEIGLLSGTFQWAMLERGLESNPCIGVRSNKPRSKRNRLITTAEYNRVYGWAREHHQRLRIAMDLAYMTTLRVSDL